MKIKCTPEVRTLVSIAFPEYKGRKFYLYPLGNPKNLDSYWDGGSRTYYVFVNLRTLQRFALPSNHPAFEPNNPSKLNNLPLDLVLVAHTIFCGKDVGVSIYANPDNMAKFLEAPKTVA